MQNCTLIAHPASCQPETGSGQIAEGGGRPLAAPLVHSGGSTSISCKRVKGRSHTAEAELLCMHVLTR